MSIEELKLSQLQHLPDAAFGNSQVNTDEGHSLSLPARDLITDNKARWLTLKDSAALIAEVQTRAGGVDYLSALDQMEKAAGKINSDIGIELKRPEIPIGECKLHPFYQAGVMIDLAQQLEQTDVTRLNMVRANLASEAEKMVAD